MGWEELFRAVKKKKWNEFIEFQQKSFELLEATLEMDGARVAAEIEVIHTHYASAIKYNDENSLSCVVSMAYLFAREEYRIEREEKTGKGYADFVFHPRKRNKTAFILELKKDTKPIKAINQMKEKHKLRN